MTLKLLWLCIQTENGFRHPHHTYTEDKINRQRGQLRDRQRQRQSLAQRERSVCVWWWWWWGGWCIDRSIKICSDSNHAPSLPILELWKTELFDGATCCTRLLSPSLITKSKRNRKGTLTIERMEKAAKIQIDRESMATFFVCFLVCLVFCCCFACFVLFLCLLVSWRFGEG